MSLIVEDGAGLPNAESLCTLSFADGYHGDRGNTLWATMTTGQKEAALRRATDYIGQAYRERWAGTRVSFTQALDWPRFGVPRRDVGYGRGLYGGYSNFLAYYPENTVPAEVQQACAQMAFTAASGELAPNVAPPVTSESVGPVSVTYAVGARQTVRYQQIDMLLAPFLQAGGGVRVVRC